MEKKFVIYHSDTYYSGAYFYDDEAVAKEAWKKLKRERKEYGDPEYIDTDCFAAIIEINKVGDRDE